MTKDEVVGIFRTCENNCKLAYVLMVLLSYDDTYGYFAALYKELKIPKPYKGLDALLQDRAVLKIAMEQLYDTVHRAALKELFEITKLYFEEQKKTDVLKAQNWYQFWRILRNCFSHDFVFRFNAHDRKQLPVTWSGVTIDASFEGRPLTHGTMSREKLWELLTDVKTFVEQ